jgi:hypothetical protein
MATFVLSFLQRRVSGKFEAVCLPVQNPQFLCSCSNTLAANPLPKSILNTESTRPGSLPTDCRRRIQSINIWLGCGQGIMFEFALHSPRLAEKLHLSVSMNLHTERKEDVAQVDIMLSLTCVCKYQGSSTSYTIHLFRCP